MTLKCLLVDDEPPALEILESYLMTVSNLELVAKCTNAIEAFGILQTRPVDLMFLDIKMPAILGTDFLRSLRTPPKVIFTTAYREYALDGFELDAVDYLLKPIALERFLRAVGKVIQPSIVPATEEKRTTLDPEEFFYFRVDRKMAKVLTRDILYVESLKDYVKIFTTSAKPLLVKRTISSVELMLPDTHFIRIHRSYLVALAHITAYSASHVHLAGQELPIGRIYSGQVYQALKASM